MKNLLTTLFVLGSAAMLSAQTISFDKTTIDYGKVPYAGPSEKVFTVSNRGDKPLIISKVVASCGCTTPKWSRQPILPGKSAKITVGYDTTIAGEFLKLIEVHSNDPQQGRAALYIKGKIDPKK